MARRRPDPTPLPGVFSREERIRYQRCLLCEWHPETQGHHPDCPREEAQHGALDR